VLPLTPSVADADVILGLEVQDLYAMTHQMSLFGSTTALSVPA
jgi:hypothetical protein